MSALDSIARHRILPVVVVDDAGHADGLGEALVAGGLPLVEVTLRTPAAMTALRALAARADLLVGAGTVLTPGQVDDAVAAGARFVVSPGVSVAVIRRALELQIPVIPGVATATDIMTALDEGVDTVKFFPAEACGGVAALRSLAAPFPRLRFVPTGGVGPGNLSSYLAVPAVLAVGGTWVVPTAAVAGDRDAATRSVTEAVALRARVDPQADHAAEPAPAG